MGLFLSWLVFAGVQLAASMSPGPAFAMALRNALRYGRRAGIFMAFGLGVGVGFHVVLVLCGLAYLISKSVFVFSLIKYAGAAYLFYIGIKALKTKKHSGGGLEDAASDEAHIVREGISDWKAFTCGVLTNALNPKAVVFFTAVFTQFIGVGTPVFVHVLYGVTSVSIEVLWFSGVAIVLGDARVKSRFMAVVHWIERSCGGLMIALGIKLALSK